MTKRTALAALLATALAAGAAQAQAQAPDASGGNVVGGGLGGMLTGGGDNAQVVYGQPGAGGGGAGWGTTGSVARFASTHGDGLLVEYVALASSPGPGREAWLSGGGDNAEVAYASPHQRR